MEFDFTALNKRIATSFGKHEPFAIALGLSAEKLNKILSNQIAFTFSELIKAAKLLDIPEGEIIKYFFTPKVR